MAEQPCGDTPFEPDSSVTIYEPLVSVIVIFFNAERFIVEAIQSIFAQTYVNWELLLIDDGSTDGSRLIAQQYAETYPGKVRHFQHDHQENRGRSASRNLGILHARGKYLAFLDADDAWLPEKLRLQVAILESYPDVAMVYGRTERWYSWTGQPEDANRDYIPPLGVPLDTLIDPPGLVEPFVRRSIPTPCTCSILVRHDAIDRDGGFDDTFTGMYDDQVLYARLCLNEPVYVSGECLDRYRRHPDSCRVLARKAGQYYSARLTYLNWLRAYLLQAKVTDARLWNALSVEVWRARHPFFASRLDHLWLVAQRMLVPVRAIAKSLPRYARREFLG